MTWTVSSTSLAERASVPELFLGPDGRPVVLFADASEKASPGTRGAMVQQADGSWVRRDTNLRGVDPNVVRLKDASYRGYTKERDGSIHVFASADGRQWKKNWTKPAEMLAIRTLRTRTYLRHPTAG